MGPADKLKIGVWRGDGPPPGYQWNVVVIDFVHSEAMAILKRAQYAHLAEKIRGLAKSKDPSHSTTISIDKIEDFYELRDRWGILGGLNVRVFFGLDDLRRCMVVIGLIAKKNDGATLLSDKIRMRRRWRNYWNGDYGFVSD